MRLDTRCPVSSPGFSPFLLCLLSEGPEDDPQGSRRLRGSQKELREGPSGEPSHPWLSPQPRIGPWNHLTSSVLRAQDHFPSLPGPRYFLIPAAGLGAEKWQFCLSCSFKAATYLLRSPSVKGVRARLGDPAAAPLPPGGPHDGW